MIYYQWSFGNWAGRSGQRRLELHATTMSCLPGSKTEFSFNQPGEEMRCNTRDTGRKGCSTVEETFKSENCPCPLHNILDEPLKIFNLLISCTVPFQRNIVVPAAHRQYCWTWELWESFHVTFWTTFYYSNSPPVRHMLWDYLHTKGKWHFITWTLCWVQMGFAPGVLNIILYYHKFLLSYWHWPRLAIYSWTLKETNTNMLINFIASLSGQLWDDESY